MTTPLFFGEAARQLFGVYQPPAKEEGGAQQAVVLCPPGPQEYMRTHWAQRRLASILSKAGFHVLRFDYFGTGDSAGGSDAGTLAQWQEDIQRAGAELRARSGASRVSLVGYRLGAALAWRASLSDENRPRHLLLWDPVIQGGTYLHEVLVGEMTFASRLLYFPRPNGDLFGYAFSAAERAATRSLDLLSEPLPKATRVHLYVGRETDETRRLATRLGELKRFTFEHVPEEGAKGSGNLLSNRILQAIGNALSSEGG
jgi:pimeloyl-ACP methyl ester carboxylesterase